MENCCERWSVVEVSRSRKVLYNNWDSEIFTYKMSHTDIIPDDVYSKLPLADKMMIAQVMEAKLTKLIADRLLIAGLLTTEGHAEMLRPIKGVLEEFDKI